MNSLPTTNIEIALVSEDNVVCRLYDANPLEIRRPVRAAYATGKMLDAKVIITLSDATVYEIAAKAAKAANVEIRLGEVTGAPITADAEYMEQQGGDDGADDVGDEADVEFLLSTGKGDETIVQRRFYGLTPDSDEFHELDTQVNRVGYLLALTGDALPPTKLVVSCPAVADIFAARYSHLNIAVEVGEVTGPAVTDHEDWKAVNGQPA